MGLLVTIVVERNGRFSHDSSPSSPATAAAADAEDADECSGNSGRQHQVERMFMHT